MNEEKVISLDEAFEQYELDQKRKKQEEKAFYKALEQYDIKVISKYLSDNYDEQEVMDLVYDRLNKDYKAELIEMLEDIVYTKEVVTKYFSKYNSHRNALSYLHQLAKEKGDINSAINYLGLLIIKYDDDLKYYKLYKKEYPESFKLNKNLIIKQLEYPNYVLLKYAIYNRDTKMGLRLLEEETNDSNMFMYKKLLGNKYLDKLEQKYYQLIEDEIYKIKNKEDATYLSVHLNDYLDLTKNFEGAKKLLDLAFYLYKNKYHITNGLYDAKDSLRYRL